MTNSRSTFQQAEEAIEKTLWNLRIVPSADPSFLQTLNYLAPAGFRPRVQFLGRKSSENWSPENGEIRIYFERLREDPAAAQIAFPVMGETMPDSAIREIVAALNDAEGIPGRTFVAIKWFRDDFLPTKGYAWAQTIEERQALLARAISDGWIVTGKIANPMSPLYPTTTIRVNRQRQPHSAQAASRFRPVPISGKPLSSTILDDRGPR